MNDVVGRGTIELIADARKLRAGIEEAKRVTHTFEEGQKRTSASQLRSIDQYIGRLQQQTATFGKSARETELYRLSLRGASNEQLKLADTALRAAENQRRNADTLAALRSGFIGLAASAALFAGVSFAAFQRLISDSGKFQDIAEKIGDSAENVASLAVAASGGGASLDQIAAASVRLTKGLTGVDDESDAAGAALASLGLNIEQFKQLSAVDQIEAIARALSRFSGEQQKTAIAVALFGRAGAELLPFLKELAGQTGRQNILTAEQIQLADEYGDKQAVLRAQIALHAQAIATQLLPSFNDLSAAALQVIRDFAGIEAGSRGLKNERGIQEFAEDGADALAFLVDMGQGVVVAFQTIGTAIGAGWAAQFAVMRGEFGQAATIAREAARDIDAILNRPLFSRRVQEARDRRRVERQSIQTDTDNFDLMGKPRLDFEGQDAAKQQIDLIGRIAAARKDAIEKGIATDLSAVQARQAATAGLIASVSEVERAELGAISRRIAAAQQAYEFETNFNRARSADRKKTDLEQLNSGKALYDNLIARNNDYLVIYRRNQAQIIRLDQELASSRRSTNDALRGIEEAGFTEEQKIGAARIRALEAYDQLSSAVLRGDAERQREFLGDLQRGAQELAQLGQTALARQFLTDGQIKFEEGIERQKAAAQSIAEAAKRGSADVLKQIADLGNKVAELEKNLLLSVKIRPDETALKNVIKEISTALDAQTFRIKVEPQIGTQALPISSATIPQFAAGGLADPGLAIVGERGPELVRFLAPARVYDAQKTRQILTETMTVRAMASGGVVTVADVRGGGAAASSAVMTHDIRINGRHVARINSPLDQVQALVDAFKSAGVGT